MWGALTNMTEYSVAVLASVIGVAVLQTIVTYVSRRKLPPGPHPLPILGSALMVLGRPLHETFAILRKRYGDINCIRVACRDVVIINGYDNIHKALVKTKLFNGRPDITWTSITQKLGIFSSEGEFYHKQHPITRQILTRVGWDQSEKAEARMQNVSQDLVAWLTETDGKPVNPHIYIDTAVSNVNSLPVIGVQLKPTDDLMKALSKICMEIFLDAGAQNVNNYLPILRNAPGDPTNYRKLVSNAVTAVSVVKDVIKSHKEKLAEDPSAERNDFIGNYLDKIQEGKEPSCTEQQLVAIVTDLIALGLEAPAIAFRWHVLLLAQNQEMQRKVQAEVDEAFGTRVPSLDYRKSMHYTNAFITEVQRYANVISINLPHAPVKDVTFMGYEIPKGTIVIPNLASVHHDENLFPQPEKFNPERFLVDGEYKKSEYVIPNSAGMRGCLGKTLSEMEIFIFLSALVKNFDIDLSGPVTADKYGLARVPGDFNVTFRKRRGRTASEK